MNDTFNTTGMGNQDWSKFDFTQWNLEGLQLDAQSAAFAGWLRDVTLSPQGQERFAAGLAAVQAAIQDDLQSQVKVIQDRASALNQELTSRIAVAQKQISAMEESMRAAGAPPAPNPDPAKFQVAAKVVDQATHLGLPGLQVRLYDTRSAAVTLASAVTDLNGNALFKLSGEQADSLNKDNAEIAMEVLTPANKSIHAGGQTVVPRLNQADTLVAALPSSPDLAAHVNLANAANAQQQSRLTALAAKVEALSTHYQQAQDDLRQQLEQVQAIVSGLQSSSGAPR